jgi:hypothetical protein
MNKEEFEFVARFLSSEKSIFLEFLDLSGKNKKSFREYSDIISLLDSHTFSENDFSGLNIEKLNQSLTKGVFAHECENCDSLEYLHEISGSLIIHSWVSRGEDWEDFEFSVKINVARADPIHHLCQSQKLVADCIPEKTLSFFNELDGSNYQISQINKERVLISTTLDSYQRTRVINVRQFIKNLEVCMNCLDSKDVKDMLNIKN